MKQLAFTRHGEVKEVEPKPFEPECLKEWFEAKFPKETTTPGHLIRKLELPRSVIYGALQTGELQAFCIRKRWYIPVPALKKWLIERYNMNLM